ncbi:MAG: tetratricopeptide repeat protein, partial [Planctomycetota bacterium]
RPQSDNRSGIRGRVTIAGERVLVPGVEELLVVNLATGRVDARIEVGHPGNAVLLDDRIVIAGDEVLKVLMPPDRAESILRERLAASPDDPSAALALVDLTLATGRPNLALESARVLEAAVARGFGDAKLRQDAVDRLVKISNDHPELGDECYALASQLAIALPALRVRVEIARGDFLVGSGRAPEAIACWRALSCDPELGAQLVQRGRMLRAVRGEALSRLARYASRDTELAALLERDAESSVTALGDRASSPVQLAKTALAHPRTMAGARAAVDAVGRGGRPELLHATLMDALVPPARVEVVDFLADASARAPSAAGGEPAERAMRRRIAELLVGSGIERPELRSLPGSLPRLGREPSDGIDISARLVRTDIEPPQGASTDLVLAVQSGALTRFGIDDLRPTWALRLDDRDPLVVWAAERIVLWQSVAAIGESLLILDPATGVPARPAIRGSDLWEASKLITADQPGAQFNPDGGSFQPGRIRPLCDGKSVHLVRANGDLARIGLESPDAEPKLMRRALGVIFVSVLENGFLVIGGRDGSRDDARATVRVLDAATLEERARFEPRSASDVRWIRTTPLGEIYVGTVAGVEGWMLSPDGGARPFLASDDPECVQTSGPAIALGASLMVRDRVDVPLRIPILGGDPEIVVLPEPPMGRSRTMRGMRLLEEGLLLHAEDRIALVAHDGALAGIDVAARERNFVFALPTRSSVLQIDGLGARQNEDVGGSARIEFAYVLQALSRTAGLRLEGDAFEVLCPNQRVDRAQVVDGWLLMSNVMGTTAVRFPSNPADPVENRKD